MLVSEMSESQYLKKEDVGESGVIATISHVVDGEFKTDDGAKSVIHWVEDLKPLVLNITNARIIAKITGLNDTKDWAGKNIQLIVYDDPTVPFGDKIVGGTRVRAAQQAQPKAAPAKAADTMAKEAPQTKEYDERNPPNEDVPF